MFWASDALCLDEMWEKEYRQASLEKKKGLSFTSKKN